MIGPTGVGKTEIARRLAKLANAPFIKVEATKFTEVGYVGKDVESIIRDLVDTSVKMTREQAMAKVRSLAEDAAYDRILDCSAAAARRHWFRQRARTGTGRRQQNPAEDALQAGARRTGRPGNRVRRLGQIGVEIMTPPGMEEMASQLQGMFQNMGSRKPRSER